MGRGIWEKWVRWAKLKNLGELAPSGGGARRLALRPRRGDRHGPRRGRRRRRRRGRLVQGGRRRLGRTRASFGLERLERSFFGFVRVLFLVEFDLEAVS